MPSVGHVGSGVGLPRCVSLHNPLSSPVGEKLVLIVSMTKLKLRDVNVVVQCQVGSGREPRPEPVLSLMPSVQVPVP